MKIGFNFVSKQIFNFFYDRKPWYEVVKCTQKNDWIINEKYKPIYDNRLIGFIDWRTIGKFELLLYYCSFDDR